MKTRDVVRLAGSKGLCKPWLQQMSRDSSLKNLCEKYFEGSDWAMEKDFPPLDILRSFKGYSDPYGLHTDFEGEINRGGRYAFFGKSRVEILAQGFEVFEIYVRHESSVSIKAKDNAFVVVNILDNAKLEALCESFLTMNIYKYSKESKIQTTGNVKVFDKEY